MSKHTPGPWKIVDSWNDHVIEGPNGEEIIFQDGPYGTPTIKIENARLIAAAPELMQALQTMVKAFHAYAPKTDGAEYNCVIEARAVIAKATGNQP
jgi:hypothetical protein